MCVIILDFHRKLYIIAKPYKLKNNNIPDQEAQQGGVPCQGEGVQDGYGDHGGQAHV